jgi:hypothetical protein
VKNRRFGTAWVAVSIAMVIFDWVIHGEVLSRLYYTNLPGLFYGESQSYNPLWFVLNDLIMAFIFLWFYDKVHDSFEAGVRGGIKFGLLAGLFANFPSQLAWYIILKGFPYLLGWAWTVSGILFYLMAGAIAGKLYEA